jgi:hypothetical protein
LSANQPYKEFKNIMKDLTEETGTILYLLTTVLNNGYIPTVWLVERQQLKQQTEELKPFISAYNIDI